MPAANPRATPKPESTPTPSPDSTPPRGATVQPAFAPPTQASPTARATATPTAEPEIEPEIEVEAAPTLPSRPGLFQPGGIFPGATPGGSPTATPSATPSVTPTATPSPTATPAPAPRFAGLAATRSRPGPPTWPWNPVPIEAGALDAFLAQRGSPLAGLGTALLEAGWRYNVDPRLLVAIAGADTSFGRALCTDYNAWNWFWWEWCNSPFESWEQALDEVARGLRLYYLDAGLTDVDMIANRYGPLDDPRDTLGLNRHWPTNVTRYIEQLGGSRCNLTWVRADNACAPLRPTATPRPIAASSMRAVGDEDPVAATSGDDWEDGETEQEEMDLDAMATESEEDGEAGDGDETVAWNDRSPRDPALGARLGLGVPADKHDRDAAGVQHILKEREDQPVAAPTSSDDADATVLVADADTLPLSWELLIVGLLVVLLIGAGAARSRMNGRARAAIITWASPRVWIRPVLRAARRLIGRHAGARSRPPWLRLPWKRPSREQGISL